MNNKFVKAINIVLIFVIILGLGITKSFADDSEIDWRTEAANYKSDDINNFLNKYGGFPKRFR